jgi:endonuclease YncB( thermonuclease family)
MSRRRSGAPFTAGIRPPGRPKPVAGLWLLLALAALAAPRADAACATVLKVYDGDTVLVAASDGRHLVRLLGIDAPETSKRRGQPGQPFSQHSRRHLTARILKRCVDLEVYGKDRYGRRLAVIRLENLNINLEMVSRGLAEVYRGRPPEGFDRRPYREAEARARREGIGMWVQGAAYRSPIDWKHGRR